MAKFKHDCGCCTIVRETLTTRWAEIIFCPLHAAADVMYEALQAALTDDSDYYILQSPTVVKIQAALALADGEKDGG
jgi:hypothetical protein